MKPFDCNANYIAARTLLIGGIRLERGDSLPEDSPIRRIPQRLQTMCQRGHLIAREAPELVGGEQAMTLNNVSIVTMSYYCDIFERLRISLDLHEPGTRKIVVTSGEMNGAELDGWTAVEGIAPFQFSVAANIGMTAAGRDDVLLTNDDCEFIMPVVETLRRLCSSNSRIGILSPQIVGSVGNPIQGPQMPLQSFVSFCSQRICFVCVYIPRRTLDIVGPLDERFTGYGADDTDYCRRIQAKGLRLAVTPLVKVNHGGFGGHLKCSSSYLRQMTLEEYKSSNREMRRLLEEKWSGISA